MRPCWGKQGIIENGETEKIIEGLKGILSDLESGKLQFSEEYEDVHMNIEQILTERIGDAGKNGFIRPGQGMIRGLWICGFM